MNSSLASPSTIDQPFDKEVMLDIYFSVNIVGIGILSCTGVITNSINLVVFYRQGIMSHSCTVCLAVVSLSDLLYNLLRLCGCIIIGIHFENDQNNVFNVQEFYIFTVLSPSFTLMLFTSCVTVYITLERCLSVTFPFKVKCIFTTKRSCVVLIVVFILVFIYRIPFMFSRTPGWIKNGNVTQLGFPYRVPFLHSTIMTSRKVSKVLTSASIISVIIFNIVIVLKVKSSQNFRKSSTPMSSCAVRESIKKCDASKINIESEMKLAKSIEVKKSKEMKLVRLITGISLLFATCFTFEFFMELFILESDIMVEGIDYHWYTGELLMSILGIIQGINASCNTFIYYFMSTSYKRQIQHMFCCKNR